MPVLRLAPADIVIVAAFVGLMLALGISTRLRDHTFVQYFAAGRRLTLPAFVASLVSTWYGGILGVGESVSYFGLGTWLLVGVPYYMFGLLYAWKLAPKARALPHLSLGEMLAARFGPAMGVVSGLVLFLLAVPAAHVLMLGVLVQSITGWDLTVAIGVATTIGAVLLWRGGLLADIRMALPAFVMMYVGFAAIVGWCLTQRPPSDAFAPLQGTPLWTFTGGQGPIAIFSFLILGAWTLVDPAFHQRVANAETPETGRRGVLVSVLCWLVFDLLSITAGLYALALQIQPAGGPLHIYPALAQATLPAGLKGVFVCGMLGTVASAMVGYTFVAGGALGRDVLGRLVREVSDDGAKRLTRFGLVIACIAAAIVGRSVESVVALWYAWAGACVGALLLPVCAAFGWFRLRVGGLPLAAVTTLSAALSLGWMAYAYRTGNPAMVLRLFGADVGVGTLVPGLLISAAGIALLHIFFPRSHESA